METIFSLLLQCHHAYFLAFAYHMKFNLFILANHVVHYLHALPLPVFFFILTFPFLVSSFSNLQSYMWKRLIQPGLLVQLITVAFSFLKRNKQHFLGWTTLWGGSLSHQCLVECTFPSCIHSHRTITKITLGKQKRMEPDSCIKLLK